jgi:hypothetical protein
VTFEHVSGKIKKENLALKYWVNAAAEIVFVLSARV